MLNKMEYTYTFDFNEAKVFEFAINKTNAIRAKNKPPLPPHSQQEFFNLLVQEQVATFTDSFRNAVMQKVSEKLQKVFMSNHADPAVQKAVLSALGLLDIEY